MALFRGPRPLGTVLIGLVVIFLLCCKRARLQLESANPRTILAISKVQLDINPKSISEKANHNFDKEGQEAEAQHTSAATQDDVDVGPVLSWKNHQRAPPDWWVETLIGFSNRTLAYPEVFESIPESTDRYMVIIEPRRYDLLEHVLRNFVFQLAPSGWGLVICHGTGNSAYVGRIVKGWRHVHLRKYEALTDTVDAYTYSKLLVSAAFWESLPGDTHLVFQTDSFLRNNTMEKWLKYDYVGAPWGSPHVNPGHYLYGKVGNGGFSLRKKEAMLRCIKKAPWEGQNEDQYFSLSCAAANLSVPSAHEAMEFSSETMLDAKRPPLGFHAPWQYVKWIRGDLQNNSLYQVMQDYNTQPFLKADKQKWIHTCPRK